MFNFFKKKSSGEQERKVQLMESSIEAFQNRPMYTKLTKEIIDSTPDNVLEQLVFDTISQIIGDSGEEELDAVKNLNTGQRAFYSVWLVEAEVNNGGFNQFYENQSGIFAETAVEGFRTFGAIKFADLMERANKLYSSIKLDIKKKLDGSLESFSESYKDNPLNDLDTEFYALYSEENLNELRISYIRSHVNEFI